jgi:hypothetical protein
VLAHGPTGAFDPQEDAGIYTEHVSFSHGDPTSYESLRQTVEEKMGWGCKLLSVVKDPAGKSVELVWELGKR